MTDTIAPFEPSQKILLIVPQPFFALRGSPMRVRCTAEVLLDMGFTVDLLALPFGEDVQLPGLTVYRTPRLPWVKKVPIGPSWSKVVYGILLSFSALRLYGRGRQYAALHGVEEAGIIAAVLGSLSGRPFVFDMHSHMSEQLADRGFPRAFTQLVETLETSSIARASGVVTVSDQLTAFAQAVAPSIPVESIQDVPLDSSTSVVDWKVEQYRKQFSPSGGPILVYTGNFEEYQGVELLVRAFARLLQSSSNPAPSLVLVGGGSPQEDPQRSSLEALASELGICSQVFFQGQQPVEEMGNFMAVADVLVSPRITGGNTPLKIYSYMVSDRPIVATRISSHVQVLDESMALLCDPTEQQLAEALGKSLNTSPAAIAERQMQIAAAKRCIEEKYSRRHFRAKLERLYAAFVPSRATSTADTMAAIGNSPRRTRS